MLSYDWSNVVHKYFTYSVMHKLVHITEENSLNNEDFHAASCNRGIVIQFSQYYGVL